MKRILTMGLIFILCLGLCACSSSGNSGSKKEKKSSSDSKDKDKKDNDSSEDKDKSGSSTSLSELLGGLTSDKSSDADPDNDDKDSKNNDFTIGDFISEIGSSSSDNSESGAAAADTGNYDDNDGEYSGQKTDDSIDLSGLSAKQGIAYVYVITSYGYKDYDTGEWSYTDSDGYIHDGDFVMQRTLTIYREQNKSSIEYMLESAGEWGEYWHIEYGYPAKCTYFDTVEGGHVELSGNTAIWTDDYYESYREIYTLSETHTYTNN